MKWAILKLLYPAAMILFTYSLWTVRTPINIGSGLHWDDYLRLRYICLTATVIFWILSLISLTKRHRSFPLLWGGVFVISCLLLILPAEPTSPPLDAALTGFLFLGIAAHLLLLVINDRRLPRGEPHSIQARNEPIHGPQGSPDP